MELSLLWLQWITALVFTICAFIWKREYYFSMFAALFWLTTAYGMVQINFIGFGSTNVIIYSHEMDDWYGDVGLFWLVWSNFIMMILLTFYRVFVAFRGGGEDMLKGRGMDRHIVGER
jgi:hypothetical protein